MITKRATLEQQFQKVKEKLAKVGMSIKRNLDTNEYQVYPKGDEPGGRSTHFTGSLDEYDLKDALNTGLDMAKRLKSRQNPKPRCKTIQVRRKIKILGRPRVVQVKRRICNPDLDLARLERLLTSELSQYDEKLQKKQPNIYRLGHYFGAVEKVFARLNKDSTLEDLKESICRNFDPELPPVKKFLKKYT